MRIPLITAIAFLAVATAGCDRGGTDTSTTGTAPATAATVAGPAPGQVADQPAAPVEKGPIWLEPDALPACGRPTVVTVHWDANKFEGVKAVDIVAINPEGKESVFVAAGRSGSRETGAWVRAGSKMSLRNKADATELASATVAAVPCQ